MRWPWHWSEAPHGWHVDAGGAEMFGPLPARHRRSLSDIAKEVNARPEVRAAREQARRREART